MIQKRNLDPSLISYINGAGWNAGWHGGVTGGLGGYLYVDPNTGGAHGDGKSWDTPLLLLTDALLAMKKWDTIFCAPGDYTGNYDTPLNADAPFCSVIGMRQTSLGLACWAAATDQAVAIMNVIARGWRISGFEFDCPTTSNGVAGGVRLEKLNATWSTRRGDYLEVDHCLFTGGKAGFRYHGGGTYAHIHDNQFDLMAGSDGNDGAMVSSDSGNQLGGRWLVENNIFAECVNQMSFGQGVRGLNSSTIKGNTFQVDAQANAGVVLLDLRGGGAGNMVINNFFGCTEAQYGSGSFIRTNANDEGMGNWAADGPCQLEIEH